MSKLNINGIVICLNNSKNLVTIRDRTKNLINNISIQLETPHPISGTIGCFQAHIDALSNCIKIMEKNKDIEFMVICEEDIIIDYNSLYYNNIKYCLDKYNKDSKYILYLGGIPTYTEKIKDIIYNIRNKHLLKAQIFTTHCYVVNYRIANILLDILKNSSKYIHCDAIIAYSGIEQKLVKGNIVNQLNNYNYKNTPIHYFISVYTISRICTICNMFSIIFINNLFIYFLFLLHFNLAIFLVETILIFNNFISKLLIKKKYNSNLSKNIFTILQIVKLFRLYSIYKILNI